MPLSKELRKMVEEKFGQQIKSSKDCEALAADIRETTNAHSFGSTTIKRMFGYASEKVEQHRMSTMDVIAKYLGYNDMLDMTHKLGDASDISMFSDIEELDIENLSEGSMVQIAYNPDRVIVMTYIGDFYFIVNESRNSKLRQGDKIRITQLAIGFEVFVPEVIRNGENLGHYHTAKDGGLTLLEVFSES